MLCVLIAACQPEESATGVAAPAADETRPVAREPVFSDRTKQADYERGRKAIAEVWQALRAALDPRATTELGFRCANLRELQKSLAAEADPLVVRFEADVEKTCGLDVPLASARAEIGLIEQKRASDSSASVRGECLGLKLALGDIGSAYASNPDVVEVGGKYATYCGDSAH